MKQAVKPRVSVIIPTYNHAHYLLEAVNSVLEQTFQDYEIVIVDDGSKDNTQEVVSQLDDPRIRYIYQENRGLAAARNTGVRAALGEYVAFLDADDLFLPCKLEVQIGFLIENQDMGFVAGGWNYIDEKGEIIGGYNPWPEVPMLNVESWLYGCQVNPVSVMVSRWWVEKVCCFDESLRQVEDWDLWLRLAYAGCPMGWVRETVCCYRFSPGQMTRNPTVQKQAAIQAIDKFYSRTDLPLALEQIKNEVYTSLYLRSAGNEYGFKETEEAKDSLSQAMKYCPELLRNWDTKHLQILFSWEDLLYIPVTPIDYRKYVFDNLPATAEALCQKMALAMGEAGLKTFYSAYHSHDWQLVRRAALVSACYSPRCVLNRGYWSIVFQSIMNWNHSPQQS